MSGISTPTNFRGLTVIPGVVNDAPSLDYVGKLYLHWNPGMQLENELYEFQVRRSHIQPIHSENVWWSSECCFHVPSDTMDNNVIDYSLTHVMLYSQSRAMGRPARSELNSMIDLAEGELDNRSGSWTADTSSETEDFTAPAIFTMNGLENITGYYYAIGITNRETGSLVEMSAFPDRVEPSHFGNSIAYMNAGVDSRFSHAVIRRPGKDMSINRSHVYYLGAFSHFEQSAGTGEDWNKFIASPHNYKASTNVPLACSNCSILGRNSGLTYPQMTELYCPSAFVCSSWVSTTCPPYETLDISSFCPSIASECTNPQGSQYGCLEMCANGTDCCEWCPPGDVMYIIDTIGEWRIGRKSDHLPVQLGNPEHNASEGNISFYARGCEGFDVCAGGGPISWTSDTPATASSEYLYYTWFGNEHHDDGCLWTRGESWIMGASQRQQWNAWWETYFTLSETGNGIAYDAWGHYCHTGSQRGTIVDLDYEIFNWDPTNLSDNNPWKTAIDAETAPFDGTLDIEQMGFTHCGVILTFQGEVLGAVGDSNFDFDDCYIRIDRYQGANPHFTDNYIPEAGWDINDASGAEVNTFRNNFNYGKVFDSRPSGIPVGNGIASDGTLNDETGVQISDCKALFVSEGGTQLINEDSLIGLSQKWTDYYWKIIIPAQPAGNWLYRVRLYEGETGSENIVWDSDKVMSSNYGVSLVEGCGMCIVDEDEIDWRLKRKWGPADAQSKYWRSVVTSEGKEFDDGGDEKWMWKDYGTGDYHIPTFGDLLPKFDNMHYLRGSNSIVIKGDELVSLGPSNTSFDLLFGQGHSHIMLEAAVEGTDLGYTTETGDSVPNYFQSDTGLSEGNLEIVFNVCHGDPMEGTGLPEDGEYTIRISVICDDTGILQYTEDIPIIVDHTPPLIEEEGNFDNILEGYTLNYGFSANDNEGLAFMYAVPQSYNEKEFYSMDEAYLMCDQCWFLDSGDDITTGFSNVDDYTLDCTTVLTLLELSRCICNGEFYMYAYASDYAGNCAVRRFDAIVDGSKRGMHPSGVCDTNDGAGPTLRPPIWTNPETGVISIYTERDCCLDSQGTWDWTTDTCTDWGDGGNGGSDWDWNEGICLDCMDNPIQEFSGTPALIHQDASLCAAEVDDVCDALFGVWTTTEQTEGESCPTLQQEGWMEVAYTHSMHQSDTNWGMGAILEMCTFMRYYDCCPGYQGGCEECNMSCVKDVIALCQGSSLAWNLVGPYMNHAGHPVIAMVITDIDWGAGGWNTNCGENATCEICFTLKEKCCDVNSPQTDVTHCGYVSFATGITNGCCNVCPTDLDEEVVNAVHESGRNVALYYTPSLDKWDSINTALMMTNSVGDVIPSPRVGAVTQGKFGEQIINIEDRLYGFAEKDSENRRWLWHSKELDMGNMAAVKMFKKIKIRGNLYFDSEAMAPSFDDNGLQVEQYNNSNVVVLIDGKQISISPNFDDSDIPQIPEYDEEGEKIFFEYEYEIKKRYQKGKTISIRLQNQDGKSVVDSMNIIYRSKPIK